MSFKPTLLHFLASILTVCLSQPLYQLPDDLVEQLHLDVRARIDTYQRQDSNDDFSLLPTVVRLAFHDCGGDDLCDGCINHLDAEHGGLEFGAVYPVEQVYQNNPNLTIIDPSDGETIEYRTNDGWTTNPSGLQWNNLIWNGISYDISRADFWILFATSSIDYGIEIANIYETINDAVAEQPAEWEEVCIDSNGNGVLIGDGNEIDCIDVLYLYGRTECDTSPFISADGFHTNTHWGYGELNQFFYRKWGMTELNVVALLGVHTLGQGHSVKTRDTLVRQRVCCGGSGFRGKWDTSIQIASMDNQYYDWLFRRPHIRKAANNPRFSGDTGASRFSDDIQWVTVSGDFGAVTALTNLFLDIDVQLFMNFSNMSDNIACNHPKMDEKFNEFPDSQGDEWISKDEDLGGACARRQISGLDNGNPWDVFDEDNIAWLYHFQEPWEIMTQNGYNFRNNNPPTIAPQELAGGSISPTQKPTTLAPSEEPTNEPTASPNANGIRIVNAQPPDDANSNWYGMYVYALGCDAEMQRVRLTPASGASVSLEFGVTDGYYYFDASPMELPFDVRISITTGASIRVRDLVTETTPGVEYYMGSNFCGAARSNSGSSSSGSSEDFLLYGIIGGIAFFLILLVVGGMIYCKYFKKEEPDQIKQNIVEFHHGGVTNGKSPTTGGVTNNIELAGESDE